MFSLGIQEILVIAIIILLLVDHRKIPEFTKGIGKIYRQIKSAQDNIKSEIIKAGISEESDELPRAIPENKDSNIYDREKESDESDRAG